MTRPFADLKAELMDDPDFRREYEALAPEFEQLEADFRRDIADRYAQRLIERASDVLIHCWPHTVPTAPLAMLESLCNALDSDIDCGGAPLPFTVAENRLIDAACGLDWEFYPPTEYATDRAAAPDISSMIELRDALEAVVAERSGQRNLDLEP